MSADQVPDVDDIKARLKEEIPVEEEAASGKQDDAGGDNFVDALRNLGYQFAQSVQTAWQSEQRQEVEDEIRKGVQHFAKEMDKVFREAKESPVGQKAQSEAKEFKTSFSEGDAGRKTREGVVQGLHWLAEELDKLAGQFTPAAQEDSEKASDEDAASE